MSDNETKPTIEGVDKLKELVEAIRICLFSTKLKTQDGATTRPMSAVKVCDKGNIYFFNQKDSDKNKEIEEDPKVQLFFSHPAKGSYLVVNGTASITTDRKKIEELWNPAVEIWFEKGKDDPNISIIKVTPSSAYFWDTDGNQMINILKMAASFVTGTNLVSGSEGEIVI